MPGSPLKDPAVKQGHAHVREGRAVALRDEDGIVPSCPKGLLKRSRQRWQAYWGSHVAKAADVAVDLHRIERWIIATDEYDRVLPKLRKQRVIEGKDGGARLNPLAGYVTKLQAELRVAETELGLTPMARLRLGIAYGAARLTAAELNRALADNKENALPGVGSGLDQDWEEG